MPGLTASEAISLLTGNPAAYATSDALRDLARQVTTFDTPENIQGKVSVFYSGTVGDKYSAGDVAKAMATSKSNNS